MQEDRVLHEACRYRGISYLTLDSAPPPNIGMLDALCVDQARTALEFLANAGVPHDEQQRFRTALAALDGRADVADRVSQLRSQLDARSVGFSNFRDQLNGRLLMDLGDSQRCLRRFHCALASDNSAPTVAAIPGSRLTGAWVSRWRASWLCSAWPAGRCWTQTLIAALAAAGVGVLFEQHGSRITDFRRGKRLGTRDHLATHRRIARIRIMLNFMEQSLK